MKKNVIRIGGIASAVCFVTLAYGQGPSISDVAWAKMVKCAAIGDDTARHTCTDSVFREAGLISEETQAAAKRQSFGLNKKSEPLAAAAAPVQAPAASAAPVSAAAPATASAGAAAPSPPKKEKAQPENLEVTLAKVDKSYDGKLTLTTTDGAIWHQVEGGAVSTIPTQGGTMTITARSLGGYMCATSKYVSFRCYRSK
jgi:hypothetical protein